MIIQTEPRTDGYMNVVQVIEVIQTLAKSQGFYQRLYEAVLYLKENDEEHFETFKNEVESQNFKDTVDVVLYFESV